MTSGTKSYLIILYFSRNNWRGSLYVKEGDQEELLFHASSSPIRKETLNEVLEFCKRNGLPQDIPTEDAEYTGC